MKKVVKSRLVAINKDKVLVLKKVEKPLRYTLPGGVKKKKETEEETLIREVGEEIKLKLASGQVKFFLSHIKKRKEETVIKNYFLIQLEPTSIKVKEKHKFAAAHWMDWKEVLPFMDKSDRLAVRSYFKSFNRKVKKKKNNGHQVSSRLAM